MSTIGTASNMPSSPSLGALPNKYNSILTNKQQKQQLHLQNEYERAKLKLSADYGGCGKVQRQLEEGGKGGEAEQFMSFGVDPP